MLRQRKSQNETNSLFDEFKLQKDRQLMPATRRTLKLTSGNDTRRTERVLVNFMPDYFDSLYVYVCNKHANVTHKTVGLYMFTLENVWLFL